jgi:hypothetical protein
MNRREDHGQRSNRSRDDEYFASRERGRESSSRDYGDEDDRFDRDRHGTEEWSPYNQQMPRGREEEEYRSRRFGDEQRFDRMERGEDRWDRGAQYGAQYNQGYGGQYSQSGYRGQPSGGYGSSGYRGSQGGGYGEDRWDRGGQYGHGGGQYGGGQSGYGSGMQHRFDEDRQMGPSRFDDDRQFGGMQGRYWEDRQPSGGYNAGFGGRFDEERQSGGQGYGQYGQGQRGQYNQPGQGGQYGQFGPHGREHQQFGGGLGQGQGPGQGMNRISGKGPKGYRRSDERIKEDVCDRLSDGYIDASEINVQVSDGVVTLTGTVTDKHAKRMAEDIVEQLSGVKDVQNQIRVQSQSTSQGADKQQSGSSQSSSGGGNIGSQGSSSQGMGSQTNPTRRS